MKNASKPAKTATGKIPNNVGFPSGGGGFIRTLTIKEKEAQVRLGGVHIIGGKTVPIR